MLGCSEHRALIFACILLVFLKFLRLLNYFTKSNSLHLIGIPVDRKFRFSGDRFQATDAACEDSLKLFKHGERSYMGRRKRCTVEKFASKKVEMGLGMADGKWWMWGAGSLSDHVSCIKNKSLLDLPSLAPKRYPSHHSSSRPWKRNESLSLGLISNSLIITFLLWWAWMLFCISAQKMEILRREWKVPRSVFIFFRFRCLGFHFCCSQWKRSREEKSFRRYSENRFLLCVHPLPLKQKRE